MGLFSSVFGAVGDLVGNPWRTGATQAGKEAEAAGEAQLVREDAFLGEIQGLYDPTIQAGQQAFTGLADYYGGNQQPVIDQAYSSPMYKSMINQGESAIARNAQATGGFRSGTIQQVLAKNSQDVLGSLIQQILQGQGAVADAGQAATANYGNFGSNMLNQIGGTSGQIANVGINQAANKTNLLTGLVSGGLTAATGGAFPSDINLKENIVKIGKKNDLNWYSWDWNKLAKSIGLSGSDEGHIAQEVELVRPDLVVTQNGYKAVIYGGF